MSCDDCRFGRARGSLNGEVKFALYVHADEPCATNATSDEETLLPFLQSVDSPVRKEMTARNEGPTRCNELSSL